MDAGAEDTTKAYVRWSKMMSRSQTERAESYLQSIRKSYAKPQIILDSEAAETLDMIQ
ncbi:hypothetical protein GCM10009604_04530 [Corynebacterium aurimucosum]